MKERVGEGVEALAARRALRTCEDGIKEVADGVEALVAARIGANIRGSSIAAGCGRELKMLSRNVRIESWREVLRLSKSGLVAHMAWHMVVHFAARTSAPHLRIKFFKILIPITGYTMVFCKIIRGAEYDRSF